jgi:hypothetical protein
MGVRLGLFAGVFGAALLAGSAADATPFTFQFDMPAWNYNSSAAEFGSSAVLDVTVDNGAANDVSQNYAFSTITGLSATTAGGSFSGTWTSGFNSNVPSTIFLTTDGSGTPTLDLLGQALPGDGNYMDSATALAEIQLAVPQNSGGSSSYYTPFDLQDYISSNFAEIYLPDNCGPNGNGACGFEVGGALASSGPTGVPEPSSFPLLLAGLGLIGGAFYFGRKKAKSI